VPVREAVAGDAEAVAAVFTAARAGMAYLPRLHSDDDVRRFFRDIVLPNGRVWVVEERDGVVAFAALKGDELWHLYVRPDAQSRGHGSELLDVVKRHRPDGFDFWVFQENEGARRFYERHGCSVVRLTDGADNEERLPDALYEWRPE
jgi:ribosomal protein S18 acetylase RimI-like enzyme